MGGRIMEGCPAEPTGLALERGRPHSPDPPIGDLWGTMPRFTGPVDTRQQPFGLMEQSLGRKSLTARGRSYALFPVLLLRYSTEAGFVIFKGIFLQWQAYKVETLTETLTLTLFKVNRCWPSYVTPHHQVYDWLKLI